MIKYCLGGGVLVIIIIFGILYNKSPQKKNKTKNDIPEFIDTWGQFIEFD